MKPAAFDLFLQMTAKHEGVVPWLYLDTKGLVTTGIGFLVDGPTEDFFTMGWKSSDGSLSTRQELQAAYNAIKARQDLKNLGGGSSVFAQLTSVRLGPPSTPINQVTPEIERIFRSKVISFENSLRSQLPAFDTWPADAQVALMRHAWAAGPSLANWPHFKADLLQNPPNFVRAAIDGAIKNVDLRYNLDNAHLMQNASDAILVNADLDKVYFPGIVPGAAKARARGFVALGSGLVALGTAAYRAYRGLR